MQCHMFLYLSIYLKHDEVTLFTRLARCGQALPAASFFQLQLLDHPRRIQIHLFLEPISQPPWKYLVFFQPAFNSNPVCTQSNQVYQPTFPLCCNNHSRHAKHHWYPLSCTENRQLFSFEDSSTSIDIPQQERGASRLTVLPCWLCSIYLFHMASKRHCYVDCSIPRSSRVAYALPSLFGRTRFQGYEC